MFAGLTDDDHEWIRTASSRPPAVPPWKANPLPFWQQVGAVAGITVVAFGIPALMIWLAGPKPPV